VVSNRCSSLRDGDLTLYDTSAETIFADRARCGFRSGGGDLDPHLRRAAPTASADVGPCWARMLEGVLVMRLYDDPVEVRRGLVNGVEAPAQFVWRGRLWVVHEIIAHWMETGAWWVQAPAEDPDLIPEREVWRVGASRGRAGDRLDDDRLEDNGSDDRPEGNGSEGSGFDDRPEGSGSDDRYEGNGSDDRSEGSESEGSGFDDRPEGSGSEGSGPGDYGPGDYGPEGQRRTEGNRGVFDLSFDWSVGRWQLARAHD
jgi:hypothetical protein